VTLITANADIPGCNAFGDGRFVRARNMRMRDASKQADLMQCPICEGRGELTKKLLLERLGEKDLAHKIESYLSNLVEAENKEELHGRSASQVTKQDAKAWNLTHFLWRRSMKE
jgi:hypothetical protein